MLNCLFGRDVRTKLTVSPFQNYLNKSENLHHHNARHAKQNSVILTQQSTAFYGIKSIQPTPVSVSVEQTSKRNKLHSSARCSVCNKRVHC